MTLPPKHTNTGAAIGDCDTDNGASNGCNEALHGCSEVAGKDAGNLQRRIISRAVVIAATCR